MIRFIGDVHGKFERYKKIISGCERSIQVGDLGIGFISPYTNQMLSNPPYDKMVKNNAYFLPGNHDNPYVSKQHSQFIKSGHIEITKNNNKIMYIGGAHSIDKAYRREGYDWWPDEELSHSELYDMVDIYSREKPDIMVTHDCPFVFFNRIHGKYARYIPNRTGQALSAMLSMYAPKMWIFGHHHISLDETIVHSSGETRAICLAELEYIDLDV